MIFRQLFDPQSSTYTYILGDEASRQAIIIDPVFEQVRRELALLEELGLTLVATLDTHVHADHVTGATINDFAQLGFALLQLIRRAIAQRLHAELGGSFFGSSGKS